MEDKDAIKIMGVITVFICMVLILSGCASGHQKGDTYKVMLGERCTKDGTISSRVWFHTTLGSDQIKKEWCK